MRQINVMTITSRIMALFIFLIFFIGCAAASSSNTSKIGSAAELAEVSRLVQTDNAKYGGRMYELTADIDMGIAGDAWSEASGGAGFPPIGQSENTHFSGTFDCKNYTISNLYISSPISGLSYNIGLFGVAIGATIKNCGLINVKVMTRNSLNVGGLVGVSRSSTVENAYVTGSVSGFNNVGSLVGANYVATVKNAYATASVTGAGGNVGGLVGRNNTSTVENAYATGDVSGNDYVGGLVGVSTSGSTVRNAYATGAVTGTSTNVGGLVGQNWGSTVTNAYATGSVSGRDFAGFFIGENRDFVNSQAVILYTGVTASYFNSDATRTVGGAAVSAQGVGSDTLGNDATTTSGLTGLSVSSLRVAKGTQSGEVYYDWLDTIWQFNAGEYPRLKTVACANRQITLDAAICMSLP